MLNKMRESAGSWIIKILLGLIVIAFIFMGAGSFNAKKNMNVANVNDETISVKKYELAYYNILENLRRQFGKRLTNEMIEMFNVKQQAMDQVIEKTLLRQVAQKNDIRVANNELIETITKISAFQKNGVFDNSRYKAVLNQNRMTPEVFEHVQKESMLLNKLQSFISDNVLVSESEAREWHDWKNAEMNIDYAVFTPSDYKNMDISEDEITAYFEKNKSDYKTQPQRKARYVKFSADDYLSAVKIADEDIGFYYEDHKDEYKTPEKVTASHILLKVSENDDSETVEKRKTEAQELMKRARSGEDFAELAKNYSEGPSTKDRMQAR